jgi:drug/metabolite transporter (DMT)-like permease
VLRFAAAGRAGPFAAARAELWLMLVMFGASFPAYKAASDGFGIGTVAAVRFLLATALLAAVDGLPQVEPRLRLRLLLIGAGGLGAQALTMTAGIDAGTSTLGALVLGLEPIGVALVAALLIGERPAPATLAGLALGLAGVAVVSGVVASGVSGLQLGALGWLLATVVGFSLYTVAVRAASAHARPLAVAVVTSVGATLVSLPFALADLVRGTALHDPSAADVAGLLYLGLGTGIAYLLFARVLGRLPADRFAVAMYAVPILGVLASWLALGERPQARDVVGGAMILAAVWVTEHRRGAPDAAPAIETAVSPSAGEAPRGRA